MFNATKSFAPVIHVRFDGRSHQLRMTALNLAANADDVALRGALARHFEVSRNRFDQLVIERHDNGNITVRPHAVFG